MIIRRFLQWAATAPADARAEAASALARAFVDREFDRPDDAEAASALIALLDDPAPGVRHAIAVVLAPSPRTPPAVASGLAADAPETAALMLEFSPVLTTAELVDAVAVGGANVQCAVARRAGLGVGISAALAEVGCAAACVELCRNETAAVPDTALARILGRHGGDAAVRCAISDRDGIAPAMRAEVARETARSLQTFVAERGWLGGDRAARVTRDAVEDARLAIAAEAYESEGAGALARFVGHLRDSDALTPALILRAALSGHQALFEAALSELSGLPAHRVAGLLRGGSLGFQSIYAKAGLPPSLRPAFAAALGTAGSDTAPRRDRIGSALAACTRTGAGDLGSVTAMLRRLDAQAAREEARGFAREIMHSPADLRFPLIATADRSLPMSSAA